MTNEQANNPLLSSQALPLFSQITPAHVQPAIEKVLAQNRAEIEHLLVQAKPYTWDSLIAPLDNLDVRLHRAWDPVEHLHSVNDSDALREAYNACLPLVSEYYTELGQHKGLYQAYKEISESSEYETLDAARQKSIQDMLRDFRLSGVALSPEKQAHFKQISQALSVLSNRFSENLLDATHAWKKHITEPAMLAGLPESALKLARAQAEQEGLQEGWLLSLDVPCYLPVIRYAEKRELREEIYVAYVSRASELGPHAGKWDNGPVMRDILRLKKETAQLLGFTNYAEYSLASKMAKNPKQVLNFLKDLATRSTPVAQREYRELCDFARQEYAVDELAAWDVSYYSEKLRLHRYALSEEELRPYFSLAGVLEGMFSIVRALYGIRIEAVEGVDVWHPDVHFFEIHDSHDELRGRFYLDPYARKGKRGGAWMGDCVSRRRDGNTLDIPTAYLVCNFPRPTDGEPSLLSHSDVTTLFHEFGHGLHHMLTRIDYPAVSGIHGVPWDAVELPSQFMENWCWQREALDHFARHYQSGAALPDDLLRKMLAAKNFQSGLYMVRQLEFALFDFRLYMEYDGTQENQIQSILDEVRQEVAAFSPPDFNRFQNSFSHIFSGGYAAGYYSYKWAEVLSADAFSLFEEQGIFNREAGDSFLRNILEQGGSRDPMELFVNFRGREPQIDALLRHQGISGEEGIETA